MRARIQMRVWWDRVIGKEGYGRVQESRMYSYLDVGGRWGSLSFESELAREEGELKTQEMREYQVCCWRRRSW